MRSWLLCCLVVVCVLQGCGGGGGSTPAAAPGPERCAGVVCTALDGCHLAGACDPATGVCTNPQRPDSSACDDGNKCTAGDRCVRGTCLAGLPITCLAIDRCHAAGTCDPATGACSTPARDDGTPCDDGDGCTRVDACAGGVCVGGGRVVCAARDACHAAGICDPSTGGCSDPVAPDGTACDDHDLCTRRDACVSGACVGASPVACVAAGQCRTAGTCDPATGLCSSPPRPDGASCDEGEGCAIGGTCQAGSCVGGSPGPCAPAAACHAPPTCDVASGRCSSQPLDDGTPCDDGSACTRADACLAGACAGADPVVCPTTAACATRSRCVPATGVCDSGPLPDGAMCEADGGYGICAGGLCGDLLVVEGRHRVHALSVGADRRWSRGELFLDRAGRVERSVLVASGAALLADPFPAIRPDGAGRVEVPRSPRTWGTLAADSSSAFFTVLDPGAAGTLLVLLPDGAPFSQAELAGTWRVHALSVGAETYPGRWLRGPATVLADGSTERTLTDALGQGEAEAYTSHLAETGDVEREDAVVVPGRGAATLSASRQLLVGVWTQVESGDALELAVRSEGPRTDAGLVGDWSFHLLRASAYGASAAHGTLAIDGGGLLTVAFGQASEPAVTLMEGLVGYDGDGALFHTLVPSFQGHTSDDGQVLVATFSDGYGDVLLLAHRRRVAAPRPLLDSAAGVSAYLPDGGGALETVASDGTRYVLELPPGAAPYTSIWMTPATAFAGLPVEGPLVGAVQLAPEGLALQGPAHLTITPPGGAPAPGAIGFTYPGGVADRTTFLPSTLGSTAAVVELTHFSGAGAAASAPGRLSAYDDYFEALIGAKAQAESLNPGGGAADDIHQLLELWCTMVVEEARDRSSTLEQLIFGPFASYSRIEGTLQRLGYADALCESLPECAEDLDVILARKVPAFIDAVDRACHARTGVCEKHAELVKLRQWDVFRAHQATNGCLNLPAFELCGHCGGDLDQAPLGPVIRCGGIAPCPMVALLVGAKRQLTPAFLTICGTEVSSPAEWRSFWPSIVGVDDAGEVSALHVGKTLVGMRATGLQCTPMGLVGIRVGMPLRRYWVTVTSMVVTSSHSDCGAVGAPPPSYPVELTVDESQEVGWDALGTLEFAPGPGRYRNGTLRLHTRANNLYLPAVGSAEQYLIDREWYLEGSEDHFVGYYDWGWPGLYDGLTWSGCHGRNQVTLERLEQ